MQKNMLEMSTKSRFPDMNLDRHTMMTMMMIGGRPTDCVKLKRPTLCCCHTTTTTTTFTMLPMLAIVVVIMAAILPSPTHMVACAKLETQIKLLINDDDLLFQEQPKYPPLDWHSSIGGKRSEGQQQHGSHERGSTAASNEQHFNLYRSELKRLSYETIHRILRDENEPNYRREDVGILRNYQKRSNVVPQHDLVRRSTLTMAMDGGFLNLTHANLSEFSETIARERHESPDYVTTIDLSGNHLKNVNFVGFPRLQAINVAENQLTKLPIIEKNTVMTMNLNGNQIESDVAPTDFYLRELHLSSNRIRSLTAFNVSLLNALETIDLSCNRINSIETTFFPQRMRNLQHLNLAHNNLGAIYRGAFYNLLSLNTLLLTHNNITDIDYETFLALPNLQYLDLSYNRLNGEAIRALQGIPDLMGLSIAHNPHVGAAMQEFVASWSLKELDASGTGLCQIPAALAQSVRTLKLTDNWLKVINCGDLDSYPLLQYLDLSQSRVEDIEDDALGRLEILEVLFLDHNRLRRVPMSLPTSLEHLFLQSNQIMDISELAFIGLRNLRTLDLSDNAMILYLPALPLPKLLTLNLQACGVKGLSQAIVHTLPSMRDLLLDDNPIKCSDLLGIAEWASPCRMPPERLAVAVTGMPSNGRPSTAILTTNGNHDDDDDDAANNDNDDDDGDASQKLAAATRLQPATGGKIDLKAKFIQMHNFFEKFKNRCGHDKEDSSPSSKKEVPPECAQEWDDEATTRATTFATTTAKLVTVNGNMPQSKSVSLQQHETSAVTLPKHEEQVSRDGVGVVATTEHEQLAEHALVQQQKVLSKMQKKKKKENPEVVSMKNDQVASFGKVATSAPITPVVRGGDGGGNNTSVSGVSNRGMPAAAAKKKMLHALSSEQAETTKTTGKTTTTAATTKNVEQATAGAPLATRPLTQQLATPLPIQTTTATTTRATTVVEQIKQQMHEAESKQTMANAFAINSTVKQGITFETTTTTTTTIMTPLSRSTEILKAFGSTIHSLSNSGQDDATIKLPDAVEHAKIATAPATIQHTVAAATVSVGSTPTKTPRQDNMSDTKKSPATVFSSVKQQKVDTTSTSTSTGIGMGGGHKHEPLQILLKDRHLIGTPLLMHAGQHVLVESAEHQRNAQQQFPLNANNMPHLKDDDDADADTDADDDDDAVDDIDNDDNVVKMAASQRPETDAAGSSSMVTQRQSESTVTMAAITPATREPIRRNRTATRNEPTGRGNNNSGHDDDQVDENAARWLEELFGPRKNNTITTTTTTTTDKPEAVTRDSDSDKTATTTTTITIAKHLKKHFEEAKKKPSLTMKKMTITTKHTAQSVGAAATTPNQQQQHHHHLNEARPKERENDGRTDMLRRRHLYKELKPASSKQEQEHEHEHETLSVATKMMPMGHIAVNTPVADGQQHSLHELNTFTHHQHQQQHLEIEQHESPPPLNSLAEEPRMMSSSLHHRQHEDDVSPAAQWLDVRTTTDGGHPGVVILLSFALFVVLLVGLMHVYRCDMPWRRHLSPQQLRPHQRRQHFGDDDAHSFLDYHQQHSSSSSSSSSNNTGTSAKQKWHHSVRRQPPYNSPLHSLHVRELQKTSAIDMKINRCRNNTHLYTSNAGITIDSSGSSNERGVASPPSPASSSSNASSSRSNSSSAQSSAASLNAAIANASADDAFYVEATGHHGSSSIATTNLCDLLPMELLNVSSVGRSNNTLNDGRTQTTPADGLVSNSNRSSAAITECDAVSTRKFGLW